MATDKPSRSVWIACGVAVALLVIGVMIIVSGHKDAGGFCVAGGVTILAFALVYARNKRLDATTSGAARSAASPTTPGWYPDVKAVNTQRYFDGTTWTDQVQPLPPPQKTVWQAARPIAIGILAAAGVILVLVRLQGPSDIECESQRTDVVLGERAAVDDACL